MTIKCDGCFKTNVEVPNNITQATLLLSFWLCKECEEEVMNSPIDNPMRVLYVRKKLERGF